MRKAFSAALTLLATLVVLLPGAPASAAVDRSLHLPDAPNARDVGGYATSDGHWVRTGVAFRSSELGPLSAAEWSQLRERGVNRVVDLRTSVERSSSPDDAPADIAYQVADVLGGTKALPDISHCVNVPLLSGTLATVLRLLASGDLGGAATGETYPVMGCYNESLIAFRETLTAIADDDTGAVVFHCTYGKDRTGLTSAILLTLLGVPRATVTQDYLASNTTLGDGSVDQAWLDSWFDEIDAAWGSFDGFVHNGLRLDDATIAKLRAKFLTDAQP